MSGSSIYQRRRFVFLIAIAALFVAAFVPTTSAKNACDSAVPPSSARASLSDAKDLARRVALALDEADGVSLTEEGRSLRATVEGVLSEEECRFLVDRLPPSAFVDAGGYESASNAYNAPREGYSGLGLEELAGGGDRPILPSEDDYGRFLEFRERVRARTEEALRLRPGSLRIDYTHVSQKTEGGTHRPHADNCFHYLRDVGGGGGGGTPSLAATPDPTREHPYANRVAASILYLNDEGFEGGEFYWASRSSAGGTPETIVPPREGRMAVFTSGVEGLHGALPVRERRTAAGTGVPSRRLVLAMWYVTSDDPGEAVPAYGRSGDEGETAEEADPNRALLFEVPVASIEIGSLRRALGSFLVGRRDVPSRNSWRANQSGENALHVIFQDQTAMISIVLKPRAIVVSRHTDGTRAPSLMYQLQESVLLHAVLTELETIAFGEEGDDDIRLVKFDKPAIDKARSTLPTR